MKSLIVSVATLLALVVSVPAQCFGVYPVGTTDSGLVSSCSGIPGGTTGPFVTPSGPLISTIGTIRVYWSNMPPITVDPLAFVAFDVAPLPVPTPLPNSACCAFIGSGLLNLSMPLLQHGVACQTGAILSFPPNPALAGVSFFGQGYMLDPTSGQWATSNSFLTTIQ